MVYLHEDMSEVLFSLIPMQEIHISFLVLSIDILEIGLCLASEIYPSIFTASLELIFLAKWNDFIWLACCLMCPVGPVGYLELHLAEASYRIVLFNFFATLLALVRQV
jgi:hypothetical protein